MATNANLSNIVASHRKPLSILGSSLGTMYFKAEARASMPNFEQTKLEVERNNNIDFCLNRTPRRFRMVGYDVTSAAVGTDAVGAANVYINKEDEESAVTIPITAGMETIGKVEENAIGKALKGDKNIIFSDPKKLAAELNALNMAEKTRLVEIVAQLNKCIGQIDSAIAENNKKVDTYTKELTDSIPSATNDVVVVNVADLYYGRACI